MKKEIIALQNEMEKESIDAYLIPTTDYHGSEYVNDFFKCRKFLSGFSGSAGTLVVTLDGAALWTDGRYFIQAEKQLCGTDIVLMKMGQNGVPTIIEYLKEKLKPGQTLGFDGRVVSTAEGKDLTEALPGIRVKHNVDLTDKIWADRPKVNPSKIYDIPLSVTGKSSQAKLKTLREQLKEAGADYHIIASMEEIAWLFNLRGSDVENTPVFFSFAIVSLSDVKLYVYEDVLPDTLHPANVTILPYNMIFSDVSSIPEGSSVLLDPHIISYALTANINSKVKIIKGRDPLLMEKAIKNPVEIQSTAQAHIDDGAAVAKFIYWLKKTMGHRHITEIDAADYLEMCRREVNDFHDLSFPTISGYGPHGAIIHYGPTPESDVPLQKKGFLLVDSGAQYGRGTTDITRTIALGPLTQKMKEYYTAVLRCNIQLATEIFPPGTTGEALDSLARKPLHLLGLNYNHGTGHGVGHLLSVHEGPNTISPRGGSTPILPGMITTDEPGVYIEGEFGIRLENELLCIDKGEGNYGFRSLTLCPFDRDAILPEKLTRRELDYLNDYHSEVWEALEPLMNKEERAWLRQATERII